MTTAERDIETALQDRLNEALDAILERPNAKFLRSILHILADAKSEIEDAIKSNEASS